MSPYIPDSYGSKGHPFSSACFVYGCEACRQKYLDEHIETLPDAALPSPSATEDKG
jgi:hypothetical protein